MQDSGSGGNASLRRPVFSAETGLRIMETGEYNESIHSEQSETGCFAVFILWEGAMEIRVMNENSAELPVLEAINEEAIPEDERCSLSDMLATGASVWCIVSDREPAGFMAVRHYGNLVYLAYLAVRKDLRSKGIGGSAVRELIRRSPGRQVVVEYEAPESPDVLNAVKRFYLRNGFYETEWYTHYDNTLFEIGCSERDFDSEEFRAFAADIAKVVSDHIPNPFRKSETPDAAERRTVSL